MAKRRSTEAHWTRADQERMRQWRSCSLVMLCMIVALVGLYVVLNFLRDQDHAHGLAPHGGVIVSLEQDDAHYHVEAVVENEDTLKLYTFGEEMNEALEVESQVLAAEVKREADAEFARFDLMPLPRPSDSGDRTSVFFGKLPQNMRKGPLVLNIARIEMSGKRLSLEFRLPAEQRGEVDDDRGQSEERLYLKPGGKYTEADIMANGRQTAAVRYQGFRAHHDMKPRQGDPVCPITRFLANEGFTWVVSGKAYKFCCPPCIDEFVRRAKRQPEAVREPEDYVKK